MTTYLENNQTYTDTETFPSYNCHTLLILIALGLGMALRDTALTNCNRWQQDRKLKANQNNNYKQLAQHKVGQRINRHTDIIKKSMEHNAQKKKSGKVKDGRGK